MSPLLLLAIVVLTVVLLSGSMMVFAQMRRQERIAARVRTLHGHAIVRQTAKPMALRTVSVRLIAGIGQMIIRRGFLPAKTVEQLQALLTSSGYSNSNGLGMFVGAKLMLAIGLPILVLVAVPLHSLPTLLGRVLPLGAAVVGLVLPDYIISSQRKAYLKKLENGLPDALDVMVICTQAGIGLGQAIVQVSTELVQAHPAVSREFAMTANELGMITDSRVALTNLGSRTGLDSFKRLSTALIQSQHYGTPITSALRMLSAEMRQEMLTRFEARAARLGVMLTLPTLIFIMPCVFMIAGGPAVIQVMRTMKNF